ncbi:MAG: biopolymer transporter ExbD [Opitutae bacterium]|nr:biopolymer transporter ExbD [Opitutae bacterium]MCD8298437.1 biopolymer transporter ExbD [Opitutae bacterium]
MKSSFDDFSGDEEATIDLTPLIDVIFMLLVFFIVATAFVKPQFEVNLPEAGMAEVANDSEKSCTITISAEGEIFFDGKKVETENLATELESHDDQTIKVFADELAPFKSVFALMDEAKKRKHEKILFMVEKKRD